MAHLTSRNGAFNVRFRVDGKYVQKSLKTRDPADAKAALHGVEQTLRLLKIGKLVVPRGVDAGDFVISGGTIQEPIRSRSTLSRPTTGTTWCSTIRSCWLIRRRRSSGGQLAA